MALKRCKQCGMLKEVEDFRKYTYSKANSTTGRYRICRTCENINTTYRRALAVLKADGCENAHDVYMKGTEKTTDAWNTIVRIEKLYETLEDQGLSVPSYSKSPNQQPTMDTRIEQLMAFYGAAQSGQTVIPTDSTVDMNTVPEDLQTWLDQEPSEWAAAGLSPEYLQETVYESLRAKYRPQVGFDKQRGLPIYDDTYKVILNSILRRFDDYEEACAEGVIESEGSE